MSAFGVPHNYFGEEVAAGYDEGSTWMFDPEVLRPTVELLAELAGDGAALEFAIGTGRVGLPLAARGVPVLGIELSIPMANRLRAKDAAQRIKVTVGDMATTRVDGTFRLVYLVFNTIGNLTSQDQQVVCFANALPTSNTADVSSSRLAFLICAVCRLAKMHGSLHTPRAMWAMTATPTLSPNRQSPTTSRRMDRMYMRLKPLSGTCGHQNSTSWPDSLECHSEIGGPGGIAHLSRVTVGRTSRCGRGSAFRASSIWSVRPRRYNTGCGQGEKGAASSTSATSRRTPGTVRPPGNDVGPISG